MTVVASGFFISEPSLANTLLKETPTDTVSPSSRRMRLRIALAMAGPSPKSSTEPVTSNQHSSKPKGSTWSV